ncbi:response regulator [Bifidobacterium parmae]|uniref:Transcriptional regulatory protein DevR (DosR) n=1 Tax=Bifidobacterium parmae TaxID=361854 RepID=A0A2N5J085_9BIFI|nr:response regulator transcription factor [Bifidobacterium parmae]PLS27628.1 Transcriptional regulatory protein DevR (DosR) [Bifidobacterium parmae]
MKRSGVSAVTAVTPIAILDNDAIALEGLSRIVERNRLGIVKWCARNGRDAVQRCADGDLMPRLLLVDMSLEGMSGVDACRQIRRRTAAVLLLGVTAFPVERYASRLMEAGAQGVVTKNEEARLVAAMQTVLDGSWFDGFESPRNAHMRLKHVSDDARMLLSDREEEVMILLSRGWSIADIADHMQVSRATAATYLSRARHKLGARTIRQAVAIWTGEDER